MSAPTDSVTVSFASGDDLKFQIDQLCQHIQNPDRRLRQDALQKLFDHCDPVTVGYRLSPEHAADVFNAAYLPLFRCYSDRFEQCRNLAASIISALLTQLPANQFYAENIVPMLCRRIGQPEIIEDSEEVRLLLVQQLLAVIEKYAPSPLDTNTDDPLHTTPTRAPNDSDPLLPCYNPIMDILLKTLGDPYPTIPRTCCAVIEALALVSAASFPARADQLVQPLIAMLAHRQSPTRIAAIRTLGTVVMHMSGNSDATVRCIVSVSPLLMDEQATVRRECARVGCRWLYGLRDRYSYFERLIPLALCGLKDDSVETRTEITELWRRCGAQYYRENEQELGRVELVDRLPQRYPADVERPTLGCRAIVQRSLRVCSIVCREMQDWKEDVRLHSLKLLWQVVLHSERALTAKFIEIVPVMQRHCVDAVREVREQALRVAALLGRLLAYDDWIGHALEALRGGGSGGSGAASLGQLRCFVAMFGEADDTLKRRHLREVCEIFQQPAVCHSMKADFQRALLDLLDMLMRLHVLSGDEAALDERIEALAIGDGQPTTSVEQLLYNVCTKVLAMTIDNADLHDVAVALLATLAAPHDPAQLHRLYLSPVLRTLHDDLDTDNSDQAEPIVLLHGLIRAAGFQPQTLAATAAAIELCMQHAAHTGRIRVLAAVSVAMLRWSETMALDSVTESAGALRKFIAEIVEPALVWQAGRNAEAMRTMATAVLRSVGQGAPAEALEVFPQLATHWVALVDDNCVVTRAYALACLLRSGPLPLEPLKSIALGVLARLDDPSGEVRELAVQVLPLLRLRDVEDGEMAECELDSWQVVVKHLMATLLLHLDSPEIKLRDRVADALVSIGRAHRAVADPLLDELPTAFYRKDAIDSIRSGISAA